MVPQKCQIDPSTAVLSATPVIANNQIKSYSRGNYLFRFTNEGKQNANVFNSLPAFAVTVDKEVIYFGIHKPSISSSSCEHSITMEITYPSGNLLMKLGYPNMLPRYY